MNEEIKAKLKADIERKKMELKAEQLLLKQMSKKPRKPFVETKFARGLNHTLVFITSPCAATYRNAKMRLDQPKAYRTEKAMRKAEKALEKARKETREVNEDTNKLANWLAMVETELSLFADTKGYESRVQELREALHEQIERLRVPMTEEQAQSVKSMADLLSELGKNMAGEGPSPQGA
jgi:uncharacterized protein YpuA (DUF1002 family)